MARIKGSRTKASRRNTSQRGINIPIIRGSHRGNAREVSFAKRHPSLLGSRRSMNGGGRPHPGGDDAQK